MKLNGKNGSKPPSGRGRMMIAAAMALASIVSGFSTPASARNVQHADVSLSFLPASLTAASRGADDVPVEVEFIFRERNGVAVNFDRYRRSFVMPHSPLIEEQPRFWSLSVLPGEELHQKTTMIIPGNIVTLAMGGSSAGNVTIRYVFKGFDGFGNPIETTVAIPVTLTVSAILETFAVGDVSIVSPVQGQIIEGTGAVAEARISATGIGDIGGQWILNGKPFSPFSKYLSGGGEISLKLPLPEDLSGSVSIQLRVTQPVVKESKAVVFSVKAQDLPGLEEFRAESVIDSDPLGMEVLYDESSIPGDSLGSIGSGNLSGGSGGLSGGSGEISIGSLRNFEAAELTEFRAGPFLITDVSASYDSATDKWSGSGEALLPSIGLELPVEFKSIKTTGKEGIQELSGGIVRSTSDAVVNRGPLEVEFTRVLIGPAGAAADGKITLRQTNETFGIGPLYFYALKFSETGLDGTHKLDKPQIGKLNACVVAVDRIEISLHERDGRLGFGGYFSSTLFPVLKFPFYMRKSFDIGPSESN